jgi:IMP dehydrogenase
MSELRLGLAYDDVLLVPRRSSVASRRDVSTRSRFTRGIELAVPIVSANMDTVTESAMAIALAREGGIGVLHRFLPVDRAEAEVARVKRYLNYVIEDPYWIAP